MDGVFAQHTELVDVWDLVVYLDVADDVRVARMARRDGVSGDPDHPGQRRYLDAHRIYHARCGPREAADVVVDNADPDRPIVVREPGQQTPDGTPPGSRRHGTMDV